MRHDTQHPPHRELVAGALLIAASLALCAAYYWPALSLYFSQDDFPLLATSRPGWVSPWQFFSMGSPREYRPLTQHVHFYLNQRLFDLEPAGHHAMNVLVHLLNAALTGLLAWRWLGVRAVLPAALLFALHPAHFYEVFWMSGVSQSGYVLFLLLSMLCFSEFHRRRRPALFAGALAAAAAAFLSKEDAVMLPAILAVLAILEPGDDAGWRRRLLSTLPFWLMLGGYLLLRVGILGFGFPDDGAYRFGLDPGQIAGKILQYGKWIFLNRGILALVLLPGVFTLYRLYRLRSGLAGQEAWRPLLLFPALAAVSLLPTLLVPSTTEHYLSFSTACLGWLAAALLQSVSAPALRTGLAGLLLVVFLSVAVDRRNDRLASDASPSPFPIPLKAELCRRWVAQLQAQAPPGNPECVQLFRDLPLLPWEKDWFIFLPMLAWDRPLPRARAHVAGTGEPEKIDGCVEVWSFAGGDVVRVSAPEVP